MYLKKMLVDAIKEVEDQLHPEVNKALAVLMELVGDFKHFKGHFGVIEFYGKNCDVVFGVISQDGKQSILEEESFFKTDLLTELRQNQFANQTQNSLYCGNTKHLLGLLTQFPLSQGDDYFIIATPDAWASEGDNAYIDQELLDERHQKDRQVDVSIRNKDYFMRFTFKERIT